MALILEALIETGEVRTRQAPAEAVCRVRERTPVVRLSQWLCSGSTKKTLRVMRPPE